MTNWSSLKIEMDLKHQERLSEWKMKDELLTIQREQFYAANPDFPIKTMFMQVTAPPQTITIEIID